ncbi:MAG: hypothetical protein RLN70_03450, partial [Rhodospirillaceae bacterium]
MGLSADIDELGRVWKKLPLLGKLLVGGTTAGSILAVSSIGDHIFAFRGFVAEGIKLYRSILEPVRVWVGDALG